ncbi:uncharacterized protein LOC8061049 [Sorghum bicolor]|uniref:DUF1618 domain-containing protein n=1 Tax=Sorghum bicolor TaxID=4558 RepID=A0A194YRC7_SORBI|nr:uncharacterized protein LOC8061049 [Sorghum bicolor]KXG30385.1 hypothetical protein SORBI_3004G173400 [Sorghum bicolor]|eukprot:XP_021315219.1 uncharacterized protein LOC8061049 [Sorghum bicolor]
MAQAAPERWFILGRVVPERHGANALVDPSLGLKLPLDSPPPRITRLTALTRDDVVRGELSIVATCHKDLLLHELERPSEPNTPNIFFLALDAGNDFMPDERAAAAGRSVFDVTATRLLNRTPGLPDFSGVRNVGFLSIRGGNGKNVVAELQANNREEADNTVPFITCRTRRDPENDDKLEWEWNQAYLNWPVVDDEANPHWTTHDVIAHDEKLWWVNLSRGLVACDPAPVKDLQPKLEFVALPVLAGFEDRHEPPAHIDRYRIVGVSAGGMRFVDVARRRNDPEGETRVVVWTLDLPESIIDARWEDNPRQTTLANIWNNSANYAQMPRDVVPVVALVHPHEPAVVYFFLEQYVFSVDVNQSAVVHFAVMPDQQDGVPRPINQRDVLAWKRPSFKTEPLQVVYQKTELAQGDSTDEDPA